MNVTFYSQELLLYQVVVIKVEVVKNVELKFSFLLHDFGSVFSLYLLNCMSVRYAHCKHCSIVTHGLSSQTTEHYSCFATTCNISVIFVSKRPAGLLDETEVSKLLFASDYFMVITVSLCGSLCIRMVSRSRGGEGHAEQTSQENMERGYIVFYVHAIFSLTGF